MNRAYYSNSIVEFLKTPSSVILGILTKNNEFDLTQDQRDAWIEEISILQSTLSDFSGSIYFEYSIPRMGKRIDVILIIKSVAFILEFKIGENQFKSKATDQVMDYALDLKNFHETSHNIFIAPILIATAAVAKPINIQLTPQNDKTFFPICSNKESIKMSINSILEYVDKQDENINSVDWEHGHYSPTPTIIEAAMALYNGHSVVDILRKDASKSNLSVTSNIITDIIKFSKDNSRKSICFVTGVPGAGKTLVGLNIANQHIDKNSELYSVYLSGNGPLVTILCEALARDRIKQEKLKGKKIKKGDALRTVNSFIQKVHHFRDDGINDPAPPREHVTLFDEAQRAWNLEQTSNFMRRRKNIVGFNKSEPEFLISCMDRWKDWAVIVCLVGGGQEINTGEAGIDEWFESLNKSFPAWDVYISPNIKDSEYAISNSFKKNIESKNVVTKEELHLSVSIRSFRAEKVSLLIKQLLDLDSKNARETYREIKLKYPIVLTRKIEKARAWLKNNSRGTERYGIMVSSQAERLKPIGVFVKSPINPIHWFLNEKDDVRSSFALEDVATEFHVQGLELDWGCVAWEADLRYSKNGWNYKAFRGNKWQSIKKEERQKYLRNAYRVLLTRARQGMIIVVPEGNLEDHTRKKEYYDPTFEYLSNIGFDVI